MQAQEAGRKVLLNKLKAAQACLFLPDYLMVETIDLDDEEELDHDIIYEYEPSTLYLDQVYHLYPRELSMRINLMTDAVDVKT